MTPNKTTRMCPGVPCHAKLPKESINVLPQFVPHLLIQVLVAIQHTQLKVQELFPESVDSCTTQTDPGQDRQPRTAGATIRSRVEGRQS